MGACCTTHLICDMQSTCVWPLTEVTTNALLSMGTSSAKIIIWNGETHMTWNIRFEPWWDGVQPLPLVTQPMDVFRKLINIKVQFLELSKRYYNTTIFLFLEQQLFFLLKPHEYFGGWTQLVNVSS
jgi:hypothetical protein